MAGSSNGYSPDGKPAIWLCHQTDGFGTRSPDWLSGYERDVLSRFSGPREREYLTSRWLIRQALSHSARLPAHQCRPVDGRPVLSGSPEGWHLSLSHSHGLSACATRAGSPVGVDLEPCTRHPQWQKVARRWFSPVEQEWLFREDDPNTFLKVWTLKEAWLKARGLGLRIPLDAFSFSLAGRHPAIEFGPQLPGHPQDWQFRVLAHDQFRIALAVECAASPPLQVQTRTWCRQAA